MAESNASDVESFIFETPIKSIAIVGAGSCGIVLSKALIAEGFDCIQIFEKRSDLGGAWLYTSETSNPPCIPCTDPFTVDPPLQGIPPTFLTPMYSNLWANTPRDIMTFADKPFPAGTPMFPFRTDILNYVKKYGEEIRHLVKFNMEVVNVEKRDNWCLTIQDLLHPAKCPTVQQFDAVAIASGHYDVPMIPSISGINDYPKEKITHAKYFRHPSKYKGQNVLLVGNGPSGADLGNQLLHYARSVRRSVRSEPNFFAVTNALVQDIVPIERFTSTTIELIDRTSLTDIDVVIFCTGYLYSLPMFPKQAGFITPDGLYVHNLYQHTFYINDPTLIFMGLPKQIIPFPTFQNQSIVVAKVWAQKLHLPSKEEMSKEELTRLEQKGFQRAKYHSFKFPEDVELSDGWVKWIDKDKSPGRENRMKPWRWTEDALDLRKRAPEVKALFLKEVDEGKWDHYHLTQP